jgi:hypothetical protein
MKRTRYQLVMLTVMFAADRSVCAEIIDVTAAKITFRPFAWRPPEPIETIDSLKPVFVHEIALKPGIGGRDGGQGVWDAARRDGGGEW